MAANSVGLLDLDSVAAMVDLLVFHLVDLLVLYTAEQLVVSSETMKAEKKVE